jgi:hypothetical protein
MEGYVRRLKVSDSSQVEEVCYDIEALKLRVTFSNGASYIYKKVPPSVFGELCSSHSVGKFLNRSIKDNFTCERIGK